MAEKRSAFNINKRGGYSGGKSGTDLRPPVRTPSATDDQAAATTNANSGSKK